MSEQTPAAAPAAPALTDPHEAHPHGGVQDPGGHHNSPEQIRKETRVYVTVFVGLLALTLITVAVSYLHLPTAEAILVALAVASIKGFLVAGYFMHLLSEKKLIYSVLLLTVFFFLVLLWGPWHHHYDQEFFGSR